MGFDRGGWEPVATGLERSFQLLLVDNRGTGDSSPANERLQVSEMARDVVAVMDDAGVAKAHLLGVSLGGMVAQTLAVEHPHRVDALVLVATTPGLPFGYPPPSKSLTLFAVDAFLSPESRVRRHVDNALSADTVRQRPELVDRLVCHVTARPPAPEVAFAHASAGAVYFSSHSPDAITARTLVLQGDADTVVDPRNAGVIASRIPGAEMVVFPGAGHLLVWEDADRFTATVTAFLNARPVTPYDGLCECSPEHCG